jgi:hypothetical protein
LSTVKVRIQGKEVMDDEEKPDSKEWLRIFPVGKKVRDIHWVSGLHVKHYTGRQVGIFRF